MIHCTIDATIKPCDLLLKVLLDNDAMLLDVRTHQEFVGFHLPNAQNIQLEELPNRLEGIKKWKKPIVVYCRNGIRSKQVCAWLKKEGIEAYDAVSQERVMVLLKDFN